MPKQKNFKAGQKCSLFSKVGEAPDRSVLDLPECGKQKRDFFPSKSMTWHHRSWPHIA